MRARTWLGGCILGGGIGLGWLLTYGDHWPTRLVMSGVGGLFALPFALALAAPRAGRVEFDFSDSSTFGEHHAVGRGSLHTGASSDCGDTLRDSVERVFEAGHPITVDISPP